MQLHQISAQYDTAQDRVLLRISTRDAREYRLWLTRRLTGMLWQGLFKLLERGAQRQVSPEAQQALLEFQREQALAQSDFSQPFAADALNPAQAEPLLVQRVNMRRRSDGFYTLLFSPQGGEGLQIQLPESMVHALAKLLADMVRRADWALPAPAAARPSALPANLRLN